MKMQFTFWKSDFRGQAYDQLLDILKQYALKGEGYWFIVKTNFVRAYLPETEYEWIMGHVANYGLTTVNR